MTHTNAIRDRLAPLALGLPEADLDGSLATHVAGCDLCAADLRDLRETAALLAFGSDTPSPRADLRARVLERIGRDRFVFVLSSEGGWLDRGGGLQVKQLFATSDETYTSLIALPARMPVSQAYRQGDLGYVVMRGELESDGARLEAGKFLRGAEGAWGRGISARTDTVLLAVSGARGEENAAGLSVRATAGEWSLLARGTLALSLAGSAQEGLEISLLRMEPGAALPVHSHELTEELCLISGDCRCQGVEFGPEDYHRASPGTTHDVTTSVGGCTMVYITRKVVEAGRRASG